MAISLLIIGAYISYISVQAVLNSHTWNSQIYLNNTAAATKLKQQTPPVLHTCSATDSSITIQPFLWQALIWWCCHTVPIITLTLRAERPCFCLQEGEGSKSLPDNLPCAVWWHATFNWVIVLCLLTFSALTRFHVHVRSHASWQRVVCGRGHVLEQSRNFKNRHRNWQWSGQKWLSESSFLARTRSIKVQRRWSDAEHGFCWEISANAHVNTRFGLAPLPSVSFKVGAFKWRPVSLG